MKLWSNNRFNELKNEVYDIVFGSDYTANRDIYEVCCLYRLFHVLLMNLVSHVSFEIEKKTVIYRKAQDLLSPTLHFHTCLLD